MLFNAAAKRLFEAVPDVAVVAHDWWAYQLVSGAGGTVIYDPEPFVSYRQHAGNLIGRQPGDARARAARLRLLLAGRMAEWTDMNLAALEAAAPLLTPEARAKMALLAPGPRPTGFSSRLALMRRLALYRQTRAGTAQPLARRRRAAALMATDACPPPRLRPRRLLPDLRRRGALPGAPALVPRLPASARAAARSRASGRWRWCSSAASRAGAASRSTRARPPTAASRRSSPASARATSRASSSPASRPARRCAASATRTSRRLSFPDAAFDLTITLDVMEHVNQPDAVLREVRRTLKPGGAYLFTVPTYKGRVASERRAHYRPDGGVDHMAEPEYHGNPVSDAGSLVTFHYGYDFAELITAWSGLDVEVVRFHDHRHGVIGEFTEVYVATQPA